MSSNASENHFGRQPEDEATIEVPVRLAKSLAKTCFDILRVLGPSILGATQHLQVSEDRKWVDWPALENDLVQWMTAGMQSEEPLPPERVDYFSNGEGQICVQIEHLFEGLWSVECLPAVLNDSNVWEPDLSERPATAILIIQDSHLALPYGWHSPRP